MVRSAADLQPLALDSQRAQPLRRVALDGLHRQLDLWPRTANRVTGQCAGSGAGVPDSSLGPHLRPGHRARRDQPEQPGEVVKDLGGEVSSMASSRVGGSAVIPTSPRSPRVARSAVKSPRERAIEANLRRDILRTRPGERPVHLRVVKVNGDGRTEDRLE